MSKDKKNKGITLIALIVSIIVVLILASVSFVVFFNSNIIQKSKFAGETYQNKINEEEKAMKNYASTMNEYSIADAGRDTITLTQEQYNNLINKNDIKNVELDYDNKVDISSYDSSSNKYTIPLNGIIIVSGDMREAGMMGYIYINDIKIAFVGGTNATQFYAGGGYSQFITKNSKIYLNYSGGKIYSAYFIPFK